MVNDNKKKYANYSKEAMSKEGLKIELQEINYKGRAYPKC